MRTLILSLILSASIDAATLFIETGGVESTRFSVVGGQTAMLDDSVGSFAEATLWTFTVNTIGAASLNEFVLLPFTVNGESLTVRFIQDTLFDYENLRPYPQASPSLIPYNGSTLGFRWPHGDPFTFFTAGESHQIVVGVSIVPEPATWTMMLGAGGLLVLRRLRKA